MNKIYHHLLFSLIIFLGGISFSPNIQAQNQGTGIDYCATNSLSYSQFVEYYVRNNYLDSALMTINNWEQSCGNAEPIFRARILLTIQQDEMDNTQINGLTSALTLYKTLNNFSLDTLKEYQRMNNNGILLVDTSYDAFTMEWASLILANQNPGTDGYALAKFYSEPSSQANITEVLGTEYAGTKLHKEANEIVKDQSQKAYSHFGALIGLWMPKGDLHILGVHPEIGLLGGYHFKRSDFIFHAGIRFLQAADTYYAQQYNQWYATKTFVGWWFGFDYGYDIWRIKNSCIQFNAGVGYDGFMALKPISEESVPGVYPQTYNFNGGATFWQTFGSSTQLGVQLKYNIVNYTLNNAIDLKGNYLSLRLLIRGVVSYKNNYDEKLKLIGK